MLTSLVTVSIIVLIFCAGCDKEAKTIPLEEGTPTRIALVGIKFQYQLPEAQLSQSAPESANVLFERLTDKFLLSLESNLKKTSLVDADELSEATVYGEVPATYNAKVDVVPKPYRFVNLSENPEWIHQLCEVAKLEYVFTLAIQVVPTQNQEPQLYVNVVVADKTGKITLKTQEPLGIGWRQLIKNNLEVGSVSHIDKEESRVIRKEGVDFGNSENRAMLERAFTSFLERYKSLAPLLENF